MSVSEEKSQELSSSLPETNDLKKFLTHPCHFFPFPFSMKGIKLPSKHRKEHLHSINIQVESECNAEQQINAGIVSSMSTEEE